MKTPETDPGKEDDSRLVKSIELSDTLLEEVQKEEKAAQSFLELTHHTKHPYLDTFQLAIEQTVFDFCVTTEFQSYGTVLDALDSIYNQKQEVSDRHWRTDTSKGILHHQSLDLIDKLALSIECTCIQLVSEHGVTKEDSKKIIGQIVGRYDQFWKYGKRTSIGGSTQEQVGQVISGNISPYDIPWFPWFQGLKKKFDSAKEYFKLEPGHNS